MTQSLERFFVWFGDTNYLLLCYLRCLITRTISTFVHYNLMTTLNFEQPLILPKHGRYLSSHELIFSPCPWAESFQTFLRNFRNFKRMEWINYKADKTKFYETKLIFISISACVYVSVIFYCRMHCHARLIHTPSFSTFGHRKVLQIELAIFHAWPQSSNTNIPGGCW